MAIDPLALRVLREKDGQSKKALADAAGMTLSYYCDIESGRRTLKATPERILQLARALNVPVSMLEKKRSA